MASTQAPAAADNVDPVYEWLDDGANYLLRLDLPGEVTVSLRRQLTTLKMLLLTFFCFLLAE